MKWFGCATAVCAADLIVKKYINDKVKLREEHSYCGDRIRITKFYNEGAMLGTLKNDKETLNMLTLTGVGMLAGALAVYSTEERNVLKKLGCACMLGGAASNAYERIRFGRVTDYIRIEAGPEKMRKVIYNAGDFALFAGTGCVLLGKLFEKK